MIISPSAISPYKIPTFQSGGVGFLGLLDEYPNAAAAYSVRRLSSTYTGNLIEVRRTVSAVTVTADVSFDSNNELSLDSEILVTGGSSNATNLGEFVAAAGYSDPDSLGSGQNAFVRTWYDQSGNANNAQQTTTSRQLNIVQSGVINTLNSIACVNTDGIDDGFICSVPSSSVFNSYYALENNDTQYLYPNSGGINFGFVGQSGNFSASTNLYGTPSFYANGILSPSSNRNEVYLSGNGYKLIVHENANTSLWGGSIELFYYPSFVAQIKVQEIIFYNTDQSANRTGIESNINSYYSIY